MRTTVVRLGFAAMLLAGGNAAAKLPTEQCLPLRAKAETRCFDRCRTAYERAYAACFGPGRDCVRSCESALHTCQTSALATDRDCESGDSNATSCLNQLVQAIDTCSADGDPHACRTRARIAAVDCRQACVDIAAPVVEECNQTFSDCLRRCSFVR